MKVEENQLTAIAIIPARGGSKRFPQKNVTLFNDKPLISWTIEAAIEAKCFGCIVVTSDDESILAIASSYAEQGIIPLKRPAELALDTATTAQAILHAIEYFEAKGQYFDVCCELLPTSPLRTGSDIKSAMALLSTDTDAVISMQECPCIPDFIFQADDNNKAIAHMEESKVFSGVTRSQDYPSLYYPNGAIYLGWTKVYKEKVSFYTKNFKVYSMPIKRSIDIDTKDDFTVAEVYCNKSS